MTTRSGLVVSPKPVCIQLLRKMDEIVRKKDEEMLALRDKAKQKLAQARYELERPICSAKRR